MFIFQLFTLKEVYEHEKSLLSHTIEDVLKADISHLNVLCIKKGWSASYALSQNKIHYNIRNTDTVIPVNAHVNLDSLNRIIGYDIRNPRKWQPDTLARLLEATDHLSGDIPCLSSWIPRKTSSKSRIQFPPDFIFQTSPGTYSYFYPALYPDYLSDLSSLSAIEK